MICVVIKGPSNEEAYLQMTRAMEVADCVEIRLDNFSTLDFSTLKQLRASFSIPMIFTLRSSRHGGNYTKSEEKRFEDIHCLAAIKPDYFDLEYDIPCQVIEEFSCRNPDIKLILSYHNFIETPQHLDDLYLKMQKIPAFFYKIAVTANNSLDALKLLNWTKKTDGKVIVVSMGSYGQMSRILGPIVGSPITYASLEDSQQTALGQLPAAALINQFHYRSLNPCTAIYGLIGDPVDMSISDETHNRLIEALGLNAIYVKIVVTPAELSEFLQLAKQLPFKGLSITMPLKECILIYLDEIDSNAQSIEAVNTLLFQDNKVIGFNTDGKGALNAIENEIMVKGKHIVVIGAGGAAKAIAYEAKYREAFVTIINRNKEKAHHIANRLQCDSKGLDQMEVCSKEGYDILINCTPLSLPIASENIHSKALVMDIRTKPKETIFLKYALKKGCRVIYGYRMFVEQALGQFTLWSKDSLNIQKCRELLEQAALEALAKRETH